MYQEERHVEKHVLVEVGTGEKGNIILMEKGGRGEMST
jgi:hypothetical protein